MGRRPCCAKEGLNRGAWTAMEDKILTDYIRVHGEGKWRSLPKRAGLKRCGKSCRLRWLNYLRPDIKRGNISRDEEDLIIRLHKLLGNRWSLIAGRLPGRTDNEIKNYWNTNIGKKIQVLSQPSATSTISNRYNSSNPQSKQNPSRTTDRSLAQPPLPNTEPSRLVRTKASRCTKVFIRPDHQNVTIHHNVGVGEAASDPGNDISPFISAKDDTSDFMMDFEMDENFLSDFLNTDFPPLYEFHNDLKGDTTDTVTSSSSLDSNQNLLSSNEMLQSSDLQSLAPLLDPCMDWLQDQ